MFSLFSIVCLILTATEVLLDSSPNDIPPYEVMAPTEPMDQMPPKALTSQSSIFTTSAPVVNHYDTYETTKAPEVDINGTSILSPYELYRNNWCKAMLLPTAPVFAPNFEQLSEFEDQYVIPGYRNLWRRTCFIPNRAVGLASVLFERGMGYANSAVVAGSSALRGVLDSAVPQTQE